MLFIRLSCLHFNFAIQTASLLHDNQVRMDITPFQKYERADYNHKLLFTPVRKKQYLHKVGVVLSLIIKPLQYKAAGDLGWSQ